MPLEEANYLNELDETSPKSGEPKGQGDNHLRLIKKVLKACFPNISGPMPVAHDQVASKADVLAAQYESALPTQAVGFLLSDGTNAGFGTTHAGYAQNEVKGADIASAATVNLTTATGNLVHITGSTAITAFTIPAGADRTIIFDGALTLTQSTGLLLPGAANIITQPGDRAIVRGDTAGAIVTHYQRADGRALRSTIGSQIFTASGNFTIPPGASNVLVEVIGGGGGGSSGLSSGASTGSLSAGGGGGAFVSRQFTAAELGGAGAVIFCTVGAGGNGGVITSDSNSGGAGGNSSFGSILTSYGGGGGGGSGVYSMGGGGGGLGSPGQAGTSTSTTGYGGTPNLGNNEPNNTFGGGYGGYNWTANSGNARITGCSVYGGGGGSAGVSAAGNGYNGGGSSIYGGGGGGGCYYAGGMAGGRTGSYLTAGGAAGGAATTSSSAAPNGGDGTSYGTGGGGGGGNLGTGAAGRGGNGGVGAGGGGGGNTVGGTRGAGGNGGRGEVRVYYW